jgi:uncharacterized protein (TIRG00374 family)
MQREKQGAYVPTLPTSGGLIKHPFPFLEEDLTETRHNDEEHNPLDVAARPTTKLSFFSSGRTTEGRDFALTPQDYQEIDDEIEDDLNLSNMSTVHLMQLSGMMRVISKPMPAVEIKRVLTGSLPAVHVDASGQVVLDHAIPQMPQPAAVSTGTEKKSWKAALNTPIAKAVIGLVVGLLLIVLMSRLINYRETAQVITENLTTFPGILHTCLAALAFTAAFTFRGARWKLFLDRIGKVSVWKSIRIFWVAVFLNFLLPVQGGEIAKSVMLKRVSGIPVSQSLPTVAMDKALDLMPVLVIIAVVPFIPGIHMNITLWLILALVGGILVGMIIVVALSAWKRNAAIALINFFLRLLPKGLGQKIEGFAMGFVDSLLAGASRPQSFLPAVLLTALAITCEGIFAWEGFQAVGLNMNIGIAIFGYTVYTMFSILPTPPGGVGTNEGAKVIVFVTLLGYNSVKVNAMAILVHAVCLLLIPALGLLSLQSLGLTLNSVLSRQERKHEPEIAS